MITESSTEDLFSFNIFFDEEKCIEDMDSSRNPLADSIIFPPASIRDSYILNKL